MALPLQFEPLERRHLDELATVLLHQEVYEHIGGAAPPQHEFVLGLERALAGPGPTKPEERWLNYLVRDASGTMVGRLEATVHHGLAEVAFLLGPRYWGRGWASASLIWLHTELGRMAGVAQFWATTAPGNVRCQRLLQRCGYTHAQPPECPLYSWEPGDVVFHHSSAA